MQQSSSKTFERGQHVAGTWSLKKTFSITDLHCVMVGPIVFGLWPIQTDKSQISRPLQLPFWSFILQQSTTQKIKNVFYLFILVILSSAAPTLVGHKMMGEEWVVLSSCCPHNLSLSPLSCLQGESLELIKKLRSRCTDVSLALLYSPLRPS